MLRVVPATERDVPIIRRFILELAEYERLSAEISEADLRQHLFGARPAAEAVIGYVDEEPAGFALFFQNFSTFAGTPGLYLEDLYVRPDKRGVGLGRKLLAHLAQIAVARGYTRMEWSVLDWNELALGVYRRIGAEPLSEWTVHRMTGDALRKLARLDGT